MMSFFLRTDDLLRGRLDAEPVAGIESARRSRVLPHLLMTLVGFGLLYGAVMGAFGAFAPVSRSGRAHSDLPRQMLYSGLKVPLLLLVTFGLSLPSFFVLNTILGVHGDFRRVLAGCIATQAGLTTVLASLSPLTAFWYAADPDYNRALLFNAAAFGVASLAAQRHASAFVPPPGRRRPATPDPPAPVDRDLRVRRHPDGMGPPSLHRQSSHAYRVLPARCLGKRLCPVRPDPRASGVGMGPARLMDAPLLELGLRTGAVAQKKNPG